MKHQLHQLLTLVILLCMSIIMSAQEVTSVEGYTYENGNRGYLSGVQVVAKDVNTNTFIAEVFSNIDGFFQFEAPAGSNLEVTVAKDAFESKTMDLSPIASQKNFLQFEMKRTPGYIFEITIAEKRDDDETPVDAIKGTRVEVYNNTSRKEELILVDYQDPEFRVNLIKGNHYTILLRKEGYLAKRMEAFVDVEGCILCFEGIGSVRPGVVETMTEGNNNGLLLANVEMERVFTGKKMELQNIYYDLDKATLKSTGKVELDKVVQLMKDNPRLTLELGSHTDSQGKSGYNQDLSDRRAKSAVDYLLRSGEIRRGSLTSRGYGETQITNKCVDGVKCSDQEHAKNRRTELKITGFYSESRFLSLAEMKRSSEIEADILSGNGAGSDQLELLPGETLDDALARMKKEKEEKSEILDSKISADDISGSNTQEYKGSNADIIVEHMVNHDNHAEGDGHDHGHEGHDHDKADKPAIKPTLGKIQVDVPNLANDISGSMVCVHQGKERLPFTNGIYKAFPDLRNYNTEEGIIMYIIETPENTKQQALLKLMEIIENYPDATVVTFLKGKLVK